MLVSAVVGVGVLVMTGWGTRSDLGTEQRLMSASSEPITAVATPVKAHPTAPAVVAAPPASAPVRPAVTERSLQVRWTVSWANVRAEPRESAFVLEQLPPGTRVEGFRRPSGWWLVYMYGDSIGYVAGALLHPSPPDTLNP